MRVEGTAPDAASGTHHPRKDQSSQHEVQGSTKSTERRWIGVSTRTEVRVAGQVDSADLRSGQNPSKKEAVKPSQDGRKTKSTTLFAAS
jgi:hypothetical protein